MIVTDKIGGYTFFRRFGGTMPLFIEEKILTFTCKYIHAFIHDEIDDHSSFLHRSDIGLHHGLHPPKRFLAEIRSQAHLVAARRASF